VSVLQLYIPAETTVLDFGAGNTPGIRMATDHHAHLTARTPLTIVSLGAPNILPVSALEGLGIYTAGHKHESIELTTEEVYQGSAKLIYYDTKDETVTLPWTEGCRNSKTEIVDGTMAQTFKSEHNLTVGKASVYNYGGPKKESITGDFTRVTDGQRNDTITKDWTINVTGKKNETIGNTVSHLYGLTKHDTYVGAQWAFNLGTKFTLDGSMAYSRTMGVSMAQNNSIAISQNFVTKSSTKLDLADKTLSMEEMDAKIEKASSVKLVTAAITLFK
jgi:hypothetical protein